MYNQEFEGPFGQDVTDLVQRYEEAVQADTVPFFSSDEFEYIVEYFIIDQNYEKALEVTETAIAQNPFSTTLLLKKAEALIELGHVELAEDVLASAEIYDPHDININLLRADICVTNNKHDEAIDLISGIIADAEEEDLDEMYLEMADIYESWGKDDELIDTLKKAAYNNPYNYEALQRLWMIIEQEEIYDSMIEFHERLSEKEPFSYAVWFNLGGCYRQVDRLDDALKAMKFAVAIDPENETSQLVCVQLLIEMDQLNAAIEIIDDALTFCPHSHILWFQKGICFESLKMYRKALNSFKKALEIDPYFGTCVVKVGTCHLILEEYELSLLYFKKALDIVDSKGSIYRMMGNAELYLERYDGAIQYYSNACEANRHELESWVCLAYAYVLTDQFESAEGVLDEALGVFPELREAIYFAISAVKYEQGKLKDALRWFEQALLEGPEYAYVAFKLSENMKADAIFTSLLDDYLNEE